ncbi:prepilin-type N-terminal cleavage/methylation domain-containing protein [Orbus wheelerorum]|uniref:type IV pilus modification PilV family protein n=1 Tax=Orbus wheelerorum TaxID=3074111 RepID=UPI00370D0EA1
MIDNSDKQNSGSSLFEVLIAIIMTCTIVLFLINLQSILSANVDLAKKTQHAERTAFQLLDVYPNSISVDLPNGWQYQVTKTRYSHRCDIVKVTIFPLLANNINQERWFCQPNR